MAGKPPYFPFFPDDWMSDEKLRLCSLAARGLWIDLLSLMHKCDRRGYLQQANGQPYSQEQIARITGCSPEEAAHLLRELISSGVASANEHGVIFNRRMVRDESIRQARSYAGKCSAEARAAVLLEQNLNKQSNKTSTASGYGSGIRGSEIPPEENTPIPGLGSVGGRGPPDDLAARQAAGKLVKLYSQLVTAKWATGNRDRDAVFRCLMAGETPERLEACLRGYAAHCREKKLESPKGCAAFFGEDVWRGFVDYQPPPPPESREQKAARLTAERKREEEERLRNQERYRKSKESGPNGSVPHE